jgi:hypothetical protein
LAPEIPLLVGRTELLHLILEALALGDRLTEHGLGRATLGRGVGQLRDGCLRLPSLGIGLLRIGQEEPNGRGDREQDEERDEARICSSRLSFRNDKDPRPERSARARALIQAKRRLRAQARNPFADQ